MSDSNHELNEDKTSKNSQNDGINSLENNLTDTSPKTINKNKNEIELVDNFEYLYSKENIFKTEKPELKNLEEDEISRLKNQLLIEKMLHQQEISKINSRINQKELTLKSISNVNSGLEKTYNTLKSKVDNFKYKRNLSVREKDEPIKIVINIKEKEIKEIQNRVNSLSKENKSMQNILDNYTDIENKRQRTDKLLFIEKENNKLKNEIKTLKVLLNDHEKCEKEKEELENTLKELENQINDERNKNTNDKLEYKSLEEKYYNYKINKSSIIGSVRKNLKNELDSSNNYDMSTDNNINNYHNHMTQSLDYNSQKRNLYEEGKKKRIQYILKENYKLIPENEKEDIFQLFGGEENKEEYENFMKKIEKLEKYRLTKSNPYKILKLKENQMKEMNDMEQQIDYMQKIDNERDIQLRFLEAKIKEYKNIKKTLQMQINKSIKQLSDLKKKKKSKEQENENLNKQVDRLRDLIKHNSYGLNNEEEINNMIKEIKEKGDKSGKKI